MVRVLYKFVINEFEQTEEIDLIRIISDQRMKLLCKRGIMMTDILNNVADDAFESMVPPGLQHLAWHNTVIEHEIEERKEVSRIQF